jgi:hypothetical protein
LFQINQVARMLDISAPDHWECVIDRRSFGRTLIVKGARLLFGEEADLRPCTVRDVTNHGAGIYAPNLHVVPLDFALSFDNFRTLRTCRLIWRHREFFGVTFES